VATAVQKQRHARRRAADQLRQLVHWSNIMRTYRDAARTAMSIAGAAGKLRLTQTQLRSRGELQCGWNPP
jgi:hypothetical protein